MLTQNKATFLTKTITLKNQITLWIESIGNPKDIPILLIAGAGSQCNLWPDAFCIDLVKKGFYVIRYDHRDTGKSTRINFEKSPYNIMDLATDAIGVLDSFNISSAHIVGFSMGGQIAQFIGAYFQSYVSTLTLMGTSSCFEPGFDAFAGKPVLEGLSPPKAHYVTWATRAFDASQQTQEEKIQDFLHSWKLLNGDKVPFDEKLYHDIALDSCARSDIENAYPNHASAMQASFEPHRKAADLIKAPTLIIHGTEDPVFPIDHAQALSTAISGSKLAILNDMGHNLNTHFFEEISLLIQAHVLKNHFENRF